jgi:hypothetical protein
MRHDPFTIDDSTPPRVRFARFVSEPVSEGQEQQLRAQVASSLSVVVDPCDTMTLSTAWWRLLGRLGALARRTGGELTVVGANSIGLQTADRVGARDLLTFQVVADEREGD